MGVLESRLIIAAVDETEKAFASVEGRIRRLNSAVASSSRAVGGSAGTVARASAHSSGSAVGGLAGTAAMVGGYALAAGGAMAAREAVKVVSARQHEIVRMAVSGMKPGEIADATVEAAKLSAEAPSISTTDTMHMLRNARSIVGSYAEAAEIAKPMMKLRVLAQLARPGQDVSEDFDKLIKGLEIKGVTQNPKQFTEYMEGIAKGINVFGDTLKPEQYYEMFKYGRQATSGLSEKFILGTAPTLAQELGGSSYGRAVSAFNAAIVGGVMKTKSVDEFYRLGLLKDADVKTLKSGNKQILAGRNVQGWKEAQSDPNAWVKDYLLPALDKLGIKDKADVLREVSTLFQNQQAGQMVGLLATQQSRIDKDLALLGNAPGLAAADTAMRKDPYLAWEGLKNSLAGLTATTFESLNLAGPMTDLAQSIAALAAGIEQERKDQDEHKPSKAIADTNRRLNRLVFGQDEPGTAQQAWRDGEAARTDAAYRDKGNQQIAEAAEVQKRIDAGGMSGGDRAIAEAHLQRIASEAAAANAAWKAAVTERGKAGYERAGQGTGLRPHQTDPRVSEAAYIASARRKADENVFGPQPDRVVQVRPDGALVQDAPRMVQVRPTGELVPQAPTPYSAELTAAIRAAFAAPVSPAAASLAAASQISTAALKTDVSVTGQATLQVTVNAGPGLLAAASQISTIALTSGGANAGRMDGAAAPQRSPAPSGVGHQ